MATPVIFDALLELQAATDATGSEQSDSLEFPLTTFHDDNDEHDQVIHVVFDVTELTLDSGVWDLQVGVDVLTAFGSETIVGEIAAVQTTGRYRIAIDLATVELLETGADFIRAGVVLTGGSSPTMTWAAYIVKD